MGRVMGVTETLPRMSVTDLLLWMMFQGLLFRIFLKLLLLLLGFNFSVISKYYSSLVQYLKWFTFTGNLIKTTGVLPSLGDSETILKHFGWVCFIFFWFLVIIGHLLEKWVVRMHWLNLNIWIL